MLIHMRTSTYFTLLLAALLIISLGACRKEDPKTPLNLGAGGGGIGNIPATFQERIQGKWDVKLAQYSASFELQQGLPPVSIGGEDPAANGTFDIGLSPNTMSYNLRFTAAFDLGFGQPIPLPINQSGTGTWQVSNNNRRLTLTLSNGDTRVFNVLVDDLNVQVWKTNVPFQIPLGGGGINADATLTLVRAGN
jgi:hypothetical protein